MNRTLVEQLAKVNPIHLSNDEKLAFWINLYNAMIMHVSSFSKPWCIWVKFNSKKFRLILVCSYQGYLAYGVPKSDLKLFSLMQKVSFNFMLVFFLFHQPFFIYIYIYVVWHYCPLVVLTSPAGSIYCRRAFFYGNLHWVWDTKVEATTA